MLATAGKKPALPTESSERALSDMTLDRFFGTDGVTEAAIRWMRERTPIERLQPLQGYLDLLWGTRRSQVR